MQYAINLRVKQPNRIILLLGFLRIRRAQERFSLNTMIISCHLKALFYCMIPQEAMFCSIPQPICNENHFFAFLDPFYFKTNTPQLNHCSFRKLATKIENSCSQDTLETLLLTLGIVNYSYSIRSFFLRATILL